MLGHRRHVIKIVIDDGTQEYTQIVRCYVPRGNAPVNFVYETDNNERQLMRKWTGVIDNSMIGPFFHVGNLNSQRYIYW